MKKLIDLWRKPLPHLGSGRALLLRLLMLPNLFLIRVEGEEHLEEQGSLPCIYAFNHNNSFESLFVPVMLIFLLGGRSVSFVIDWMFGRLPLIGWLMNLTNPVYVFNKRSTLAFLERIRAAAKSESESGIRQQCLDRLASGTSIGIFPEGTRNRDPRRLLKARPGLGYIAIESAVPVIPVGIEFTAARRRKNVPVFGRMTVRIGKPICFNSHANDLSFPAESSLRERHSRLAGEATGEVMEAISRLCGKSYPYRKSTVSSIIIQPPEEALCPS